MKDMSFVYIKYVGGITSLPLIIAHEIQVMVSEYQISKRTGLPAETPTFADTCVFI